MRHLAQYTLFLATCALLASGPSLATAAPSWASPGNSKRSAKASSNRPSYKTSNRKRGSQSSKTMQSRKTYRPSRETSKTVNRSTSSSNKTRDYRINPRGNQGGSKYVGPSVSKPGWKIPGRITDNKGSKGKPGKGKITYPIVPKPGWKIPGRITDNKGTKDKPIWKIPGRITDNKGSKGKPGERKITYPFVPKPGWKIPGRITDNKGSKGKPGERKITYPFVPKPGERRITGPLKPELGVGGINPKGRKPLPRTDILGKGLQDFWKKGNRGKNQADLLKVKNFANKCFGLPAPCGWWVDFCCWNWWDSCCYPGYWDCWHPCYWDYVYCPSRVVVVNGVQQVLEEVSYYLGISGSQIPNFGFGIQQVKANSPAERAGLVSGDVIVSVNGREMTGEEVLATAMQQTRGVLDLEVVGQGSDTPRSLQVVAEQIRNSSF